MFRHFVEKGTIQILVHTYVMIIGLDGWVRKMAIFAYYQYIEGEWVGQKKSKNLLM